MAGRAWQHHEVAAGSRFEIRGQLGEGATGVVYDAFDHQRGARVALKMLRTVTRDHLLTLKNEFRAVQDLRHPNLVRVRELFEENGAWFATMDVVDGVPFDQYVRRPAGAARDADGGGFDEARLRSALAQLVRALRALHDAHKVHRDVKPANILVTPSGRLVVVDFGLVQELAQERVSSDGGPVGTPAFMAPEQVLGEPVGPAADWYAVGVMLYVAMTGQLPFPGGLGEMLEQKLLGAPRAPSTLEPRSPADLEQLCMALLRAEPAARPSGAELLAWAGSDEDRPRPGQVAFVGRSAELAALDDAFQSLRRGGAVTVLVQGESGVGKSYLVREYMAHLRSAEPDVMLLHGRCFESESVPFKAIDGVIDQLAVELSALQDDVLASLLPDAAPLLGRAFPVLRDVVAMPVDASMTIENPRELRARVFATLRELFARLVTQRTLVLVIDDLQWADGDSLALLSELLRPPAEPGVLLIATLRAAAEPRARPGLEPSLALRAAGANVRELRVEALSPGDARALAVALLGSEPPAPSLLDAIVEDAQGHPLFISELVRQGAVYAASSGKKLDDTLWERTTLLEPAARRLLELVAVAGLPIAQETAEQTLGIGRTGFMAMASALRDANFARTAGAHGDETIEPYHDRVRESVLARLDADVRRAWHGRLAGALEASPHADAETLAKHWEGAGDLPRAAGYAARAADAAMQAFAFEHAAELYRRALALSPSGAKLADLRRRLADALANAGHLAQSADVYLELSREAERELAVDHQRRAFEQLLQSGRFDDALDLLRAVLKATGIYYPAHRVVLLLAVASVRFLLRARGLGFRPRLAEAVTPGEAVRADAAWSAGIGFGLTDHVLGAYFQTRYLLRALQLGERDRIARGLGLEVCFHAAGGAAARERTGQLLSAHRKMADELGTPEALAMCATGEGYQHYYLGEWRKATDALTRAEALFRDRCVGVSFQLNSTRLMIYRALMYMGRVNEVAVRVPPVLREAEHRSDKFMLVNLVTGPMVLVELSRDEPERARRANEAATEHLANRAFTVQHYFAVQGRCQLALYQGERRSAHAAIERAWPSLRRALLTRVQSILVYGLEQRARCAVAAALEAPPSERRRLLALAEAGARALARERLAWAAASAAMTHGLVAHARGRGDQAVGHYARAADAFGALDMALHAAAARHRLGELQGGSEGAELVGRARAGLHECGVQDPERMLELFLPRV